MKSPAERLLSRLDLFDQTGNREYLREARAIAECMLPKTEQRKPYAYPSNRKLIFKDMAYDSNNRMFNGDGQEIRLTPPSQGGTMSTPERNSDLISVPFDDRANCWNGDMPIQVETPLGTMLIGTMREHIEKPESD